MNKKNNKYMNSYIQVDKYTSKEEIKKEKNKSRTTIILKILLLFFLSGLIGILLFDFHSSKVTNLRVLNIVNELDKKIEENKKVEENKKIIEEQRIPEVSNKDTNKTKDSTKRQTFVNETANSSVIIEDLKVFGKIKINKIGIEYPIIEYIDEGSLWKSICKISNNYINGEGNLCLAGHNMRNMTMFAKIKKLELGDTIEITNVYGNKYIYKVYESYYVDATEVDVLKNTSEAILTMITCDNTSSKRLIVRAKLQ